MPQTVDVYSVDGNQMQQMGTLGTSLNGVYYDGHYMWLCDNESASNVMVEQHAIDGAALREVSSFDIDAIIGGGTTQANGITGDGVYLYVAYEFVSGANTFSIITQFTPDGEPCRNLFANNKATYGTINDITCDGMYIIVSVTSGSTHQFRKHLIEDGSRCFDSATFGRAATVVAFDGMDFYSIINNTLVKVDVDGNTLNSIVSAAANAQLTSACFGHSEPGKNVDGMNGLHLFLTRNV